MTQPADIGSKRLISLAPESWVQWVTQFPDVEVRDIISSDFQWVRRESDVLVRAYTPEYGEFLLLNELQLRYKPEMPKRMRAYAALAEEKYNLPAYPVLVNILQERNVAIPTRYESEFAGLQARQDYRVINLWEVDVEIAFQQSIKTLLPFVPVLRGGAEESTVRRALQTLRADEQLNQLETLLAFFATFVLDSGLVQQIMRWDMAILSESPWYHEILAQGRKQEALTMIVRPLTRRFGSVSPELQESLHRLSLEQLEELSELLLDFAAITDLETWLSTQGENQQIVEP
ncbi:DUF4351 domain-containing protein [Microcoleus sp. FACHB-68]|uniref:DUF4351 domain-containing protein n=1 Tax=Microcoleus sp. FACHB-68 TaxID=2692826 RepID=UPI00168260EF|nr:DUF4351 domain-containing protein [Microcoleus sp. FACHB-68]MBD1940133.1 DUF4351 domain-containing protein [Microcoleus sp. FACHB-68]